MFCNKKAKSGFLWAKTRGSLSANLCPNFTFVKLGAACINTKFTASSRMASAKLKPIALPDP